MHHRYLVCFLSTVCFLEQPQGVRSLNRVLVYVDRWALWHSNATRIFSRMANRPLEHKQNRTMQRQYPILEHDPSEDAILEPKRLISPLPDMPEHGVITFFQDVIDHFVEQGLVRQITTMNSEMKDHPVYVHQVGGCEVALFHPGVGAPLAAGLLEEMIALGCRKFVACGGAGVLDREIATGHLIVPIAAVRDEGTSYHYLPPSREVSPSPQAVAAIETVLRQRRVDYTLGKTWTTDAIYRETRAKMAQRRAEGCVTVEMEAAALFAVAQFRGVALGQILYGGDNLDADEWDSRGWQSRWSVREMLVELAAEACLAISENTLNSDCRSDTCFLLFLWPLPVGK